MLFSTVYAHNETLPTDGISSIVMPSINLSWARMKTSIVGEVIPNSFFETVHPMDLLLFAVLILAALELLNCLVKFFGRPGWMGTKSIPVRGKHLDDLSKKDLLFIGLNKAATPPFVYFLIRYSYYEPNMLWNVPEISMMNTLAPLPILFIIYDFFYTILHWALHVKSVYGWIHKHHHHQKAPSRAQNDAVNVHPIEFFLGEYNHLFTIYLLCNSNRIGMQMHALSIVLFMLVGGGMASMNHTRYDVVLSLPFLTLYDSKNHDVHHRLPQSNYGQYIMFWDYIFGSYRAYNANDRTNPSSQLDPLTGKSYAYAERKKLTQKIE